MTKLVVICMQDNCLIVNSSLSWRFGDEGSIKVLCGKRDIKDFSIRLKSILETIEGMDRRQDIDDISRDDDDKIDEAVRDVSSLLKSVPEGPFSRQRINIDMRSDISFIKVEGNITGKDEWFIH